MNRNSLPVLWRGGVGYTIGFAKGLREPSIVGFINSPPPSGDRELRNNFDLLRLIAASFVIFSHSFPLFGHPPEPLINLTGNKYTLGALGVQIFFVISGYLITQSWMREPNLKRFFLKRCLRIFPALVISVIFTILVIGTAATNLPLSQYLANSWAFLSNAALYTGNNTLPGIFDTNPSTSAVNGSLWTLPIEFLMYVIIALLGFIKKLTPQTIGWIIILLFFLHLHTDKSQTIWNETICLYSAIKRMIAFLIGSLLFFYRKKLPFTFKGFIYAFVLLAVSVRTDYFHPVLFFTLPYLVICFAHFKLKFNYSARKYGDYSYGLYIYAYPIQQTIAHFFNTHNHLFRFIILAYVVTFIMAFLSWHLIEKRALNLKQRGKL